MLARATSAILLAAGWALAQPGPPAANYFKEQIQPLLDKNCLACHNAKVKQGGLDLSTREALLRGSEHGKIVVLGNPADSQLYKVVAHVVEPGMPFKGKKLPDDAIAKFSEWVKAGVPYGDTAVDTEGANLADAAKHWAFRKPVRPAVPASSHANPIDAFLAAERNKRGLAPLGETDKRTLIRRVYLDLTGLPPASADIAAYLADQDPKAYEKIVDRLLASAEHSERWGRHWLDIWRYSDWYGSRNIGQVRYSQRHIWRWRDWTLDAISANKPYDRMILEMLAGDEVAPGDPDTLRATGYLARSWYMFNRNVWLQDVVDYTSTGFLGLTLKCARCHTHKYDPIPHSDYYKMRAFFEPHEVRTDRVSGQPDVVKDGLPRVYDADVTRPTYRFVRGNENNPDTSMALQPAIPQLFGKPDLTITPVAIPASDYFPDGRDFVPRDLLIEARAAIERAEASVKKARDKPEAAPVIAAAEKRVEAAKAALPALEARIEADRAAMTTPAPPDTEALAEEARRLEHRANTISAEADLILAHHEFNEARKDPEKTDEKKLGSATRKLEAALKALKDGAEGYTPLGPKYPSSSSGRRTALAKWIGSKDNPLTARVAINHMWLRHFGEPLAPNVFNFGKAGKPPTHPELLDWLATEFMAKDWDMKAMHRLIVTSAAYRMKSAGGETQVKADPDNVYLWRMNVRRMEAEAVRDSMISLAGKLDATRGGPELDETKGHELYRRSLYFRHTPDLQMDMLKVFDAASPIECFERTESIVPQQALALSNGRLSFAMARTIAGQLRADTDEAFVAAAFERVLGRAPHADEAAESQRYLAGLQALYRDPSKLTPFGPGPESIVKPSTDPAARARESLVHVLFNHNDFVTIR